MTRDVAMSWWSMQWCTVRRGGTDHCDDDHIDDDDSDDDNDNYDDDDDLILLLLTTTTTTTTTSTMTIHYFNYFYCYRRNFEGDENDRKHFGPAPNKLMPDVVNLQTHINISHAQMNKNNGAFKALKNSERDAERWLEKVGKEGRWCIDDNDDGDDDDMMMLMGRNEDHDDDGDDDNE
jgi:hypothetical protein